MIAIGLMEITLAGVRDDPAVGGDQSPSPVALDIDVLLEAHRHLMSNDEHRIHLFRYRHAGMEWQVKINATDADDARARIGKLAYATYDGVAISEQPIILAPIGIASVWLRNAARRLLG